MSDAKVTFSLLNELQCEPGKEQTFSFACPLKGRCEGLVITGRTTLKRDPAGKNGGVAQWDWTNAPNRDAPTFSPSINCGCGWHGYIENGRCVTTAKKDEPEPV